ncbi:ribonuclease Z [Xylanibacter muris]|uniref:Ribonuclease Z n=1 Tax=Xylanibacter muris TaxID=2736290 RepID=A0ABX2AQ34_9BACT|nr:ribonuclease Z [Xylanibacter muris]NPD92352.1 ribonuclease Z [Xylanibacter muris]
MQPFRIHVLGCGSALPTLRHNPTSQIVELRGKMFMIDCGEGTQLQLRRSRIRFTKLGHVFLSHLHGDHCFGLIGMISTFGMLGRTAPLHIYAHHDFEPVLRSMMDFFCTGLEYEVVFHPTDCGREEIIYEDRSMTVTAFPLDHRIPCCGFLFREKPSRRHINRNMIDFYKVPLSQINNIREGMDWVMPDGTVIPNERLTLPPDPVRSYAYCSDTRYMPELHNIVNGVSMLYHESTYGDDNEANACKYYHSTAAQAARVACEAKVGKLLLGHYSARYDNENLLLKEARAVFPDTQLAMENNIYDIV